MSDSSRHMERGHWYRRGRTILLDPAAATTPNAIRPGRSVIRELEFPPGLIDPRIDVHAQYALQRMLNGDPAARVDGTTMLAAVKAGQLAGIYIVNQAVPAKRAQKLNLGWWQLIPKGEDAILLLDADRPFEGAPLIAFRDQVKSDPSRLDPAIRKAWASYTQTRTGQLARCDLPIVMAELSLETQPGGVPVMNVVPPVLCQRVEPPKPVPPPLDKARPGETFCSGGADVRNVNDGHISQKVKKEIYYDPGQIISKHLPNDSSRPNPDYPSGRVVIIPFETADHPRNSSVTATYLSEIFFSARPGAASAKNYFSENSWGLFQLSNGGISDWVRLPRKLEDYGPVDGVNLLQNVLRSANIDWNALDMNGDRTLTRGEVTIVYLIPNADSALTRGFAHVRRPPAFQAATPGGTFRFNLPIVQFSVVEQADPDPRTNPIRRLSSVCHELCHAFFELSDRYGATTGTGPYDIMSADRTFEHMNIHAKMKIGWIQPKMVRGHLGTCLAFPASARTRAALLLISPETLQTPLTAAEYWLVENRHKGSSAGNFDAGLPASGLAVWWVKTRGFPNGHDEVRLVDFSKPDQKPTAYQNPGAAALFKRNDADPLRTLFSGSGRRSFCWFRGISQVGKKMFGEF